LEAVETRKVLGEQNETPPQPVKSQDVLQSTPDGPPQSEGVFDKYTSISGRATPPAGLENLQDAAHIQEERQQIQLPIQDLEGGPQNQREQKAIERVPSTLTTLREQDETPQHLAKPHDTPTSPFISEYIDFSKPKNRAQQPTTAEQVAKTRTVQRRPKRTPPQSTNPQEAPTSPLISKYIDFSDTREDVLDSLFTHYLYHPSPQDPTPVHTFLASKIPEYNLPFRANLLPGVASRIARGRYSGLHCFIACSPSLSLTRFLFYPREEEAMAFAERVLRDDKAPFLSSAGQEECEVHGVWRAERVEVVEASLHKATVGPSGMSPAMEVDGKASETDSETVKVPLLARFKVYRRLVFRYQSLDCGVIFVINAEWQGVPNDVDIGSLLPLESGTNTNAKANVRYPSLARTPQDGDVEMADGELEVEQTARDSAGEEMRQERELEVQTEQEKAVRMAEEDCLIAVMDNCMDWEECYGSFK
jgi:hypothetical protein